MNLNTLSTDNPSPLKSGRASLRIGGVSAILASICCVGPYLFVAMGISSSLALYFITLAEWSRPFFILIAFIALCFAYQQIWRPELAYNPGRVCTTPQVKKTYKGYFFFIVVLVVSVLMLPYIVSQT